MQLNVFADKNINIFPLISGLTRWSKHYMNDIVSYDYVYCLVQGANIKVFCLLKLNMG